MDACCRVEEIPSRQRRILLTVLWINLVMFAVEIGAGLMARSTALVADSVDMLGDAVVYGVSFYAVGRSLAWRVRAARLKGALMAAFGAGVLLEVVLKLARGTVPAAGVMSAVGALALGANVLCLVLLWSRRGDDVNMRSAWLCSGNDVAANLGVLAAAAGVALTGAAWPDIVVGLAIAAMFGASAVSVLIDTRRAAAGSR